MTEFIVPDSLPVLSRGNHSPGSGYACAMNAASIITGRPWEKDHPTAVDPLLCSLFITVNDSIGDGDRHLLWPLILRAIGTTPPDCDDPLARRRLVVGLLTHRAEELLTGQRVVAHPVGAAALKAARVWYRSPDYLSRRATFTAEYQAGWRCCRGCNVANAARIAVTIPNAASLLGTALHRVTEPPVAMVDILDGVLAEYTRLTGRPGGTRVEVPWDDLTAALGSVPA